MAEVKRNIRVEGGVAVCNYCGFAMVAGQWRDCCREGRWEDDLASKAADKFMSKPTVGIQGERVMSWPEMIAAPTVTIEPNGRVIVFRGAFKNADCRDAVQLGIAWAIEKLGAALAEDPRSARLQYTAGWGFDGLLPR